MIVALMAVVSGYNAMHQGFGATPQFFLVLFKVGEHGFNAPPVLRAFHGKKHSRGLFLRKNTTPVPIALCMPGLGFTVQRPAQVDEFKGIPILGFRQNLNHFFRSFLFNVHFNSPTLAKDPLTLLQSPQGLIRAYYYVDIFTAGLFKISFEGHF